jgi:DNA mismatch repair ATPase MutS
VVAGERQDLVQIFAEDTEIRQSVQEDHLKSVPDMHRLAKRFQRGFASLQVSKAAVCDMHFCYWLIHFIT